MLKEKKKERKKKSDKIKEKPLYSEQWKEPKSLHHLHKSDIWVRLRKEVLKDY